MMTNLNQQEPEHTAMREDGVLEIVDIFPTIQGEGPLAGMPATFIRLAGCNLSCPDCDTDYTSNRRYVAPDAIRDMVDVAQIQGPQVKKAVVLTGGEPLRQNVVPLIQKLLDGGYIVQIETNGVLPPPAPSNPLWKSVVFVCSPKGRVHEELRPFVKHLKYVVEAGRVDHDGLPLIVLGRSNIVAKPWWGFNGQVWIQPSDQQNDECNKANMEAAVASCLKFGYRLSVQLHKVAGLK